MNATLVNQLRDISKSITRESNLFSRSPDLLSPTAVYAVENLRELQIKLNEQITVIAQHQSAAAKQDCSDREGIE